MTDVYKRQKTTLSLLNGNGQRNIDQTTTINKRPRSKVTGNHPVPVSFTYVTTLRSDNKTTVMSLYSFYLFRL